MAETDPDRALYVGYLPVPGRHRRFLLVLVPALLLGLAAAALAITLSQRSPGRAVWDTGLRQDWTGVLTTDPYPMLTTDAGESFLVVGMGKFGVHDRVGPHAGARCRLSGWSLARDGRRMIELDPDPGAIEVLDAGPVPGRVDATPGSAATVSGEIVDGKCFLGAMKPGDGKGHKACAILCIAGGLPPMLATRRPDGSHAMILLLHEGSTDLPREVLDLVSEPVVVDGTLRRYGGLEVLDAAGGRIRPAPRRTP